MRRKMRNTLISCWSLTLSFKVTKYSIHTVLDQGYSMNKTDSITDHA